MVLLKKVLTLLEERTYRVLGEPGASRRANVRFVVGTNADLSQLVREGSFREDLYYRINVLPMALPPRCSRTALSSCSTDLDAIA